MSMSLTVRLSIVVNDLAVAQCRIQAGSSDDKESMDGEMRCLVISCGWTLLRVIANANDRGHIDRGRPVIKGNNLL